MNKDNDISISCLTLASYTIPKNQVVVYELSNINSSLSTHYLIYQMVNNVNGKHYIGQHTTDDPFDEYTGSGKLLCKAQAKYGLSNFTKTILFDFDNFDDMNSKEMELVQLSNCYPYDKMSYNLQSGGSNKTDDLRRFLKDDSSGRCWVKNVELSVECFIRKSEREDYFLSGYIPGRILDQSGEKNPIHSHIFSEEECLRRSSMRRQEWSSQKRKASVNYMSPETYQEWILKLKDRDGPNKGKHLSKKTRRKVSLKTKGKIKVNNGTKNTYADENNIPEGFVVGWLPKAQIKENLFKKWFPNVDTSAIALSSDENK